MQFTYVAMHDNFLHHQPGHVPLISFHMMDLAAIELKPDDDA